MADPAEYDTLASCHPLALTHTSGALSFLYPARFVGVRRPAIWAEFMDTRSLECFRSKPSLATQGSTGRVFSRRASEVVHRSCSVCSCLFPSPARENTRRQRERSSSGSAEEKSPFLGVPCGPGRQGKVLLADIEPNQAVRPRKCAVSMFSKDMKRRGGGERDQQDATTVANRSHCLPRVFFHAAKWIS